MNHLEGKIAITGTGRCRTTWIMRLLTAYDPKLTGFKSPTDTVLVQNQAGMERRVHANSDRWDFMAIPKVWKDPGLTQSLPGLVAAGHVPDMLIVPIRDTMDAARSRLRVNRPWFPSHPADLSLADWPEWITEENQARVLEAELGRLVACATLNQIPLILIPWEVMEGPATLWDFLRLEVALFGCDTPQEALGLKSWDRFKSAYGATWEVEVK